MPLIIAVCCSPDAPSATARFPVSGFATVSGFCRVFAAEVGLAALSVARKSWSKRDSVSGPRGRPAEPRRQQLWLYRDLRACTSVPTSASYPHRLPCPQGAGPACRHHPLNRCVPHVRAARQPVVAESLAASWGTPLSGRSIPFKPSSSRAKFVRIGRERALRIGHGSVSLDTVRLRPAAV
jgi:hypothetical protein